MRATCVRTLCVVLCLGFASSAWAFTPFRVGSIQIEGLQRLEQGTVLTYLPVSVGDKMNQRLAQRSIRSLYRTGLFENVSLARDGETLIVKVRERPEIASFKVEGNKKVGGKQFEKSLKKQGLTKGKLYKKELVSELETELRRQYYANGYYGVKIDKKVTPVDGNRVKIHIQVHEGKPATIKDINIVGNHAFSDKQLLAEFEEQIRKSKILHPLAAFRGKANYSKQKMQGDLESMTSYYQDRGYLRFHVTSVQVSLSPDKRDIYLTVNVHEGPQYTVSAVKFAGKLIVPESNLRRLVSVRKGEIFSRKQVTSSSDRISTGLADFGYAFAHVKPLTKLDNKDKTVALTFFVDPGKRTYVRHINFSGNQKTNDKTLRREMRQFEGAPFSRRAVKRSRTRLARLPYISSAKVKTRPVPGSNDLVDVDFNVEERPAGTLQFGVGFSDAEGFLINASVSHNNLGGTGDQVKLSAQTNDYAKVVSASWTNPYATPDGISRTVSGFYRHTKRLVRYGAGFDLNRLGGSVTYSIPLSEFISLRLGGGIESDRITSAMCPFGLGWGSCTGFPLVTHRLYQFADDNGKDFVFYQLRTGIVRDTRNRTFFATSGSMSKLNWDINIPGSDIEYWNLSFQQQHYFNISNLAGWLPRNFVLKTNLRVADAYVYGKGTDVPPWDNYFAGGARSVRGFRTADLGPHDSLFDDPLGGQFLTTLQNELIIPTPLASNNKSTRFALFYDIGNVFSGADKFRFADLRKSAGVAFYWFTPFFGLLRISYAAYVDARPGDRVRRFQFSFGVGL